MSQDKILLAFEITGVVVYLFSLLFALREKKPFYLGIFLACNLMIFWDWIFNSKWFFNVQFNEELTALWTIQGEQETLAAGLAFVGFYYFVFHLLVKYADALDRKFGRWQYAIIYVVGVVYVVVFEVLFVNLDVWTYYQKEAYEFYGMAWSNTWFNSHLVIASYLLLRYFKRWGNFDESAGLDFSSEECWKQIFLAIAAITTGFFLAFALQMIWYINTDPWVQGPRHF